ncbi:endonuclease [Psychrobium sp. MM17-31]|uniref:endonuclease n=1 Tax=Psychrobium sp. MM17-31 TaxID=2917758 RepID=UPI001EF459A7|nr:endonuclease [Psychrobium sp. MM17-31]MCG7532969.1 endonuclease [Psychrobium sp. MM17-31]
MMKLTSKLQLSALTLALGVSTAAQAELIITEYIEGSSNNKAVELTNRGTTTLDLTGYVLNLHSNGGTDARNPQELTGELAAGASIVIYNSRATDSFKKPAPQGIESSVTFFNGDDALTLTLNGVVVDSFGQVGTDPGSSWSGANGFETKDKTLRRLESVTTGDVITYDAFPGDAPQWQVFDKDTADGLGCDGIEACDGSVTPPVDPVDPVEPTPPVELPTAESPLVFSEYIEGGSFNKAIEIGNTSDSALDLTGYSVAMYSNGATDAKYTLDLSGSLTAKGTLVIYNKGAENAFKIADGIESNVTAFNGDDALLLLLNGAVVDSFGQLGTDPGTSWSSGDFNSKDKTLRRKNSVTAGDKVVGDAYPGAGASEWIVLAKDTSDGLGCIGDLVCPDVERVPEELPNDDECTNCPTVAKVADRNTYDENVYYANALVASDEELRGAINKDISKDQKKLTYSEVWTVVTHSDEDPTDAGKVIEIYTGRSIGKGLNAGKIGNSGDAWNREHVWAKSHGFPDQGQYAYTDAHHLRPADASVNSERSNLDFDNGGTPITEAPENAKDSDSFEPRDQMKGDVARMLFYMDVRYEGAAEDKTPDLVLVDRTGTENGTPELGKLCTLYAWHQADPVSDWERNRNDVVYEFQGNRNPFIDRPEWVQQIFGAACGDAPIINTAPTVEIPTVDAVTEGDSVSVTATAVDAEGDELTYLWTQTAGPAVEFDATSATLSFTAPEIDEDTIVAFTLVVSDGEFSVESGVSVAVEAKPAPIHPAVAAAIAYIKRILAYFAWLQSLFSKFWF